EENRPRALGPPINKLFAPVVEIRPDPRARVQLACPELLRIGSVHPTVPAAEVAVAKHLLCQVDTQIDQVGTGLSSREAGSALTDIGPQGIEGIGAVLEVVG